MLALYRKYRPQVFSEVIGQEHIKKTLENELKMGRTSHAYLFYGPRGIGKTTIGRILAKALNCEKRKNNDSEPCNECNSCLEITQGKNLDELHDNIKEAVSLHYEDISEPITILTLSEEILINAKAAAG